MWQRPARLFGASAMVSIAVLSAAAQTVTTATVPGIANFRRLDTTIACAGATSAAALPELKKMGYASVISLRLASEAGADVEREAAAARAANINFVHLPFNTASPDPALVDDFIKAVTDPRNQPAFVHCASGNRAAALWMIKRMLVDRWDAERAGTEAAALGLTSSPLKTFVLDYVAAHR